MFDTKFVYPSSSDKKINFYDYKKNISTKIVKRKSEIVYQKSVDYSFILAVVIEYSS